MFYVYTALVAALMLLAPQSSAAHELHGYATGGGNWHVNYNNWTNRQDKGCCNNNDCRPLEDKDIDEDGGQVKVRVEGMWCDVQHWHYLKTGNAPDWSSAHVCVTRDSPHLAPANHHPCARLQCFQPKPGT